MGMEERNNNNNNNDNKADAGINIPDEKFLNSDQSSPESNVNHPARQLLKQTPMMVIIFAMMGISCLVLYHSSITLPFISGSYNNLFTTANRTANSDTSAGDLKSILKNATMSDNTVIITSLNDAWAEPQSIFDTLLESFRNGNQTKRFLEHLVVICLDQKAYARCLKLHPHCYNLITNGTDFSSGEAFFMGADYLKIVWRKIDFLRTVLDLGYSFVFTDADIVWFRDPFSQFHKDADFQVSCDNFNGNSSDLRNMPNTGFSYVKSNEKTIQFYKLWYDSRLIYPRKHDQDVFNMIKFDPLIKNTGLEIRFFDTAYFGGFCEPSKDLNKVCTMHANCCVGLDNKVHDLGILLDDWRKYTQSVMNKTTSDGYHGSWTAPQFCRGSLHRPYIPKKKNGN